MTLDQGCYIYNFDKTSKETFSYCIPVRKTYHTWEKNDSPRGRFVLDSHASLVLLLLIHKYSMVHLNIPLSPPAPNDPRLSIPAADFVRHEATLKRISSTTGLKIGTTYAKRLRLMPEPSNSDISFETYHIGPVGKKIGFARALRSYSRYMLRRFALTALKSAS